MNFSQQYLRKDLNGLRFISVIGIILYQSKITFFNSGFIGVDIFFVLSGFFITQILLFQKKTNNLSFFLFLNKRFRRILPALVFVMIISLLTIYFFYMNQNIQKLLETVYYIHQFFYQIIISISILGIILLEAQIL